MEESGAGLAGIIEHQRAGLEGEILGHPTLYQCIKNKEKGC
jgi:hypothetical protein